MHLYQRQPRNPPDTPVTPKESSPVPLVSCGEAASPTLMPPRPSGRIPRFIACPSQVRKHSLHLPPGSSRPTSIVPKTHILVSLESPGVLSGPTSKFQHLQLPGDIMLVLGLRQRHEVVTQELAFWPQLLRKREAKHGQLELLRNRTCHGLDQIKPLPKLPLTPMTASSGTVTVAIGSGAGVHAAKYRFHTCHLPGPLETDSTG